MPANFDPNEWEVVSEPNYGGYDPNEWEVVGEYDPQQYEPTPTGPRNYERESRDALLLRQQAQREAEQQPDESTTLERIALGAGQGVRSLESGLGGLFNLAGLTSLGRYLQQNARAGQSDLADVSSTLAGQNPDISRELAENWSAMATQQAPTIAAAALTRSPTAAAWVAGLQSAGQVQDQAEQAYEAQGLSPDAATNRARIPALASGAITGALTRLMPGGTERLATMMFAGPAARTAAREGVYGVARRIFGEALREAPEEILDQLGQDVVGRFSYDPDKPLEQILMDAWEAGGWGVGTAGAVGTLAEGMNAADRAFASRPESAQTGMNLRMPESAAPESAAQPVPEQTPQRYSENPVDYVNAGMRGEQAIAMAQQAQALNRQTDLDEMPPVLASEQPFVESQDPVALTQMDLPQADFTQIPSNTIQVQNETPTPPAPVAPPPSPEAIPSVVQPETIAPIPETTPPVSETIAPPVAENVAASETTPPTDKKSLSVQKRPTYERPPDIVDWVTDNGKFRRIKPGEQSAVAEQWRAAQKARPELFADNGSAPDEVAEAYRRETGKDFSDGDFLQEIIETGSRRVKQKADFYRQVKFANQDAAFQKVLVENDARDKNKTTRVTTDAINPGDKFRRQGENFTATKKGPEGVTFRDGPKFGTQTVPLGTSLHIQKGSIRRSSTGKQHGLSGETPPTGSQSRETPQPAQVTNDTPPPPSVNDPFSLTQPPAGWATVEPGYDQQQRITNAGAGLENARATIEQSNLSPQHKRATLMALDAFEKSGLNTQKLWLEIRTYLEGREAGSVSYHPTLGAIVRIMEGARADVGPHEVFHLLIHALPEQYRAALESERVANMPADAPESVRAGTMTSLQFRESGLPLELYPFINLDEYGAYVFGNRAAQASLEATSPGIIEQIKQWFARLWSQLKALVKDPVASEAIFKAIMDGTQQYDGARAAERGMERSTFVETAKDAYNAAELATTPNEQQIEGESQLAQAQDIVAALQQFGVSNTSPKAVQDAFDYQNWTGIRDTGETLNGSRENYQQMKARLAADPYRRARLAGEAGQSILRFGEILDNVQSTAAEAFKKLTSRHFQDFIARVQAKAAQNQAAQSILTTSKSTFDSAIKEATAALKEEAKSDRDMAVLQGEIQNIKEASESTVAMEQTMTNLVNVLSMTPEGQNAMLTGQGGPRKIEKIYRETQQASGQPIHNQNLLKWAAYIVAKNPKLAAKVQASNLAQQSGLRAQLNGMARQLADDFSRDPVATVRRSLRDREKAVKNATTAEFAFKQLEEDLLSELEPLLAAVDAGGIAAQIKADPQFQALRREILNDQTSWGGSPEPAKAMRSKEDASSTLTMPVQPGHPMSGATIGIGHDSLGTNVNTANLRTVWDEHRRAIEFLESWLANPQNADDPMRRYHAHNLDTLKNYYGGQQHLMPENQSPLWNRAYSIIGSAVGKSGSRLVGQARSVLNRADQMHKWSRDWFDRAVHALPVTQRAAIASHGIKWNNLRGQSIVQANRIYQQRVGQELAASWARQQGGYNVGDTLSNGEVVTREDMAHLEAQSKAGFDALNLAAKYDEQITKDARGLRKTSNYRSALRTSPYLLPRMFDYSLQSKAKAVGDAVKAGDPAAIESTLNQMWPDIGLSLLVDRNPEFAKRTIFDGKGNGFDNAANSMRSGTIPDIDSLARELSSQSTMTPDQARSIVLDEFGRIVSQWSAAVEEKVAAAEQGGKSGDAKNSFTQARGDALAPWTFYKTGFTTTDDVSNHAAGMQSVALDRVTASLEAIQKDLERQANDLSAKAKEFERVGKPNAIQTAVQLKEVERRRGQTFDSWNNLKERQANIDGVLKQLQNPAVSSTDFDTLFNRGAGALVGSLIGNVVTTMKNISSIFLGRQLRAAGMDEFNTTLRSALFTKAEAAKILASFGLVGVPKSIGYLLRGMAKGVPQLMQGNARQAYLGALRDVIRELSVNVPRRLKSVRDLEAAGLYQLPDAVAKFDNQILGSILYRGGIPANELTGMAKAGGYTAGIFEATLLALANAGFPTMGDAAVNGAMQNAVNSRWGPVQGMQDSLKKVFVDWQNGKPRTFNLQDPADPVNRLSPKELGLTEQTLSQVRRTYEMAGMSFDERAAAYMAELQNNPQAQFLTTENRNALTETLINKMNRSSFSNAPLKFKDGSFLSNMVRPLYGWSLRSFADWEESMAVPTNTESGKMKLWATSMALAAVALAMTGAGGQLQDELMARMLKRGLHNQESQNRLPWEEPTLGRKVANVTRLGMESVPLLGILGNMLLPGNSPARASFEPTLALWESGKALASWIHGMVASGDPMFGLPEMLGRFVPDSKIVLNRLESQAGRREGSNAVADIKRFADPDLVRPQFRGAVTSFVDESTPWKQRMDNAAYRGDRVAFRQAANEAVQANVRMGKKPTDARKAVQSYWRSRNPETRALTRRMTPGEEAAMMERAAAMGKNHAQEIQQAKQDWARAGALIGVQQRQGGTNRVSLRAPSLSSRRGMARY